MVTKCVVLQPFCVKPLKLFTLWIKVFITRWYRGSIKKPYIIAIYICALFFPILSVATFSVEVCWFFFIRFPSFISDVSEGRLLWQTFLQPEAGGERIVRIYSCIYNVSVILSLYKKIKICKIPLFTVCYMVLML